MRLENAPVWLVTGSSSGLGLGTAQAALAAGARVIATARRPQALAELEQLGGDAVWTLELDVTDAHQAQQVVDRVLERHGRIDVVVNNAACGLFGAVEEVTDEQARRQLEVNFFGALNVLRATVPVMRRRRAGRIIQISSVSGVRALAGYAFYSASKWALEAMSESLRDELAPLGIEVCIVQPGPFATGFLDAMDVVEPSADYEPSVAPVLRQLMEMDQEVIGSARRAGEVIVALAALEAPPARLALGSFGAEFVAGVLAERAAELARWREMSRRTDARAGPLPVV
jgi:NAD(P)-dependent dehydrogenase (short-subunit alcohol dehydrogenase family)